MSRGVVFHTTPININRIGVALMKKRVLLVFFVVCNLLLLGACKPDRCSIVYVSDEGGSIYGNINQTV